MKQKTCSRCRKDLDTSCYGKHAGQADGLQPLCKGCQRDHNKEWYKNNKARQRARVAENSRTYQKRNREYVYQHLLLNPCVACGEKDPVVLEFDHVRGEKANNVSSMVRAASSIDVIKKEIAKCDVVCANCHRRRTAYRNKAHWAHKIT